MRTRAQLKQALASVANVSKFAREHKLPRRTLARILAGGTVRNGTLALVSAALDKERDA